MPSSTTPSEDTGRPRVQLTRALKPGNTAELRNLLDDPHFVQNIPENDFREHLGKAVAVGSEAAVRLLLQAGAKTDVTAGSGPLHRAIKNQSKKSRNAIVNLLIDHGCDINLRDADKATPLMVACLRGQDDVIKTLLDRGADPDLVDDHGRTVLHKMAAEATPNYQWSSDTLTLVFSSVRDLNQLDKGGRSPLLSAAANGQRALTGALLRCKGESGVDVNQTNEQGHSALHLAAKKNEPEIVKLLLFCGANIEARGDGGWTPLLVAAKEGNEAAVDALLTHKANVNACTSAGMTSLHWAAENGKTATVRRLLREANCLKNGKDSFDCTPLIHAAQNGNWPIVEVLRPYALAEPSVPIARRACERFRGAVVSFFADEKMRIRNRVDKHTVWQILYARDPDNAESFAIPTVSDNIKTKKPLFRWIHLPANNVSWLEALLTRHYLETNSKDVSGLKSILRLLGKQQHRGAQIHSRFMRPLCKRIWGGPPRSADVASLTPRKTSQSNRADSRSGVSTPPRTSITRAQTAAPQQPQSSQDEDMMVLCMPYLHWETDRNRRSLAASIKAASDSGLSFEDSKTPRIARDILLIHGYIEESTDLHPRRTLDQFKHHGDNTETQDADQVVYRYCLRNNQDLKIFMVDQLWLIILGDLLITCFPERWDQPRRDPLNLFDGIIEDVNSTTRPPVRSVYELATLVTERCNGIFDRHQLGHDEYLFAEMFELSIGLLHRKETALFRRFKNDSVAAAHRLRPQGRSLALYEPQSVDMQAAYASEQYLHMAEQQNLPGAFDESTWSDPDSKADAFLNRLLSIDEEAALLVECKDIEDELEILASVLRQQRQVLTDMEALFRGSRMLSSPLRLDLYKKINEQQRQVDLDILDLERMAKQARSVNDNLTQVLDLKQKHASAVEARFQRVQAQETARQGRTIMVFTIVTIVFLPLSFLASFFALNIIEFPRPAGSQGGTSQLHLGWVIKYILGIGLGLSVPLIGLAFVVGDIQSWWLRRRERRHKAQNRNEERRHADRGIDPGYGEEKELGNQQRFGWLGRQLRRRSRKTVRHDDLPFAENGTIMEQNHMAAAKATFEATPTRRSTIMPLAGPRARLSQLHSASPSTFATDRDSNAVRTLQRTGTMRTDGSIATEDLEIGRP